MMITVVDEKELTHDQNLRRMHQLMREYEERLRGGEGRGGVWVGTAEG